jgi:hypothetical protein
MLERPGASKRYRRGACRNGRPAGIDSSNAASRYESQRTLALGPEDALAVLARPEFPLTGEEAVIDAVLPRSSYQRSPFPLCLLLAAVIELARVLGPANPARAQTPERPAVSIASTVIAEPATQAPFPIRVDPTASIPRDSFVRVRGLPPTVALSEGYSIAPGSWAIALNALPGLKIVLPAGVTGTAEILITLVGMDGSVLAESKSTLVVRAAPQSQASPGALVASPPAPSERAIPIPPAPVLAPERRPRTLTPQDQQRALGFVKKGDELLDAGNVEAARQFYERAADAGLAQAALAMAATYDPNELVRRQVVGGLQPDLVAARRWYERARELGAAEAEDRLRRLGAR